MKDDDEVQINEAIENADFENFFLLIQDNISSYKAHQFISRAIIVAKHQKNIHALKQFLGIQFSNQWDSKSLFEEIIKALVELDEIDMAFGVVARNDGKKVEAGEGWYLLAKPLLAKAALDELKQILNYIKKSYQREEIAKSCLEKITLPEQLSAWLEWFELYAQTATYISLNFEAAILALSAYPDFKSVCDQLQKINPSEGKQQLLRKLYLNLLVKQEFGKIDQLNLMLPDAINWLSKIPQVLEDESQFGVLEKLECYEIAPLIILIVESLLVRQQSKSDEDLAEFIKNAANLTEKHRGRIIETACNVCLKNLKPGTVINLLCLLEKYVKTRVMLKLLEYSLSISQYQIIIQQLDRLEFPTQSYQYYVSDEEKIIDEIPEQLVFDERNRRKQELVTEIQEKFARFNIVHSNHPQYRNIRNALDQLLDYKLYDEAFILCHKLASSKIRDNYLVKLLHYSIKLPDYVRANKIAKMFFKKEIQQVLSQLSQYYKTANYRNALKILIKLKNEFEFPDLVSECVNIILAESNSIAATNFLIDNDIFNLPNTYSNEFNTKAIKRNVMHLIIVRCRNDKGIIKFMVRLKQRNIKNFELYLLEELLATDRLAIAIKLLNACLEENYWGERKLPDRLRKLADKITSYIGKKEPSIEILNILALLEEKFLKINLIHTLFRYITQNPSIAKAKIIASTPDEGLKLYYLIELIISCLNKSEFLLAKQALLYLPKDNQSAWSQIVACAEQDKIGKVLEVILNEAINNDRLLDWIIKRHFIGRTPNHLLKNLLTFCQNKSELDSKMKTLENSLIFYRKKSESNSKQKTVDYGRLLAEHGIYYTLISQFFFQWHTLLLKAKAHQDILDGIKLLLPLSEHFKPHDLFSPLRSATKSMVEAENYDDAFISLQLLIKHDEGFSYSFDEIFDILLENNALTVADRLLKLVQENKSHWLGSASIKLSEIYLIKEDYKKIIDLLKPQHQWCTIQRKVKDWVINLIKADKITVAINFIDTLLPTTDESYFIDIIEALIAKNQLAPALKYIQDKVKTLEVKLRLKDELKQIYLATLEGWLGKDPVDHLLLAQQKLAKFMQFIKNLGNQKTASQLKNEIITDLRSQLDKAFLAFYRSKYGEPPLIKGNYLNVFFPVVPDLKGKAIEQRLKDYFQYKLSQPNFAVENPELFQYLKRIQPSVNLDYLWLKQLYGLANKEKHDSDLPLQPKIDGIKIDMREYLPKLINGVTELLLKLNHPCMSLDEIRDLQFSRFVPLVAIATAPELKSFGMFPISANSTANIVGKIATSMSPNP